MALESALRPKPEILMLSSQTYKVALILLMKNGQATLKAQKKNISGIQLDRNFGRVA